MRKWSPVPCLTPYERFSVHPVRCNGLAAHCNQRTVPRVAREACPRLYVAGRNRLRGHFVAGMLQSFSVRFGPGEIALRGYSAAMTYRELRAAIDALPEADIGHEATFVFGRPGEDILMVPVAALRNSTEALPPDHKYHMLLGPDSPVLTGNRHSLG